MGLFNPMLQLRGGVCMGLFNPMLQLRGGVCTELFNPMLQLRGGVCMGLFNPMLQLRGVCTGFIQPHVTVKRRCMYVVYYTQCYS